MNRLFVAKSLALVLPAMLAFSACSSVPSAADVSNFFDVGFGKKSAGLDKVDDLLDRIERVHVEAELSRETSDAAMNALRSICDPEFSGEALDAYTEFVKTIDDSEKQADKLRKSIGPMKKTAESVFAAWASDLEGFGSAEMRQRSQQRLEQTRQRYVAISTSVDPALWAYDALNHDLRDHALFLSHDFNSAAIADLSGEVDTLSHDSDELTKRLDKCLKACEGYIRSSALRGQLQGQGDETDADEDATER